MPDLRMYDSGESNDPRESDDGLRRIATTPLLRHEKVIADISLTVRTKERVAQIALDTRSQSIRIIALDPDIKLPFDLLDILDRIHEDILQKYELADSQSMGREINADLPRDEHQKDAIEAVLRFDSQGRLTVQWYSPDA